MEEIGEQIGFTDEYKLTRERVRQLCLKINSIFQGKLSHLIICFPYIKYNLNLQYEQDFIIINNEFANRINIVENVNFTPKFYTKFFSVFINNNYKLFLEDTKEELNLYLINRELFKLFDFDTFYNDLEKIVNRKLNHSYSLNFEGYLYNFLKTKDINLLERIKPICETILFEHFNLIVDLEGSLNFESNIKKTREDYAVEILEEYGRPMHLTEIYDNIQKKYPDVISNLRSLQSAIQYDKQFICFGRTSTYGLKKWEEEYDSIKGGAIKDIVEEYWVCPTFCT